MLRLPNAFEFICLLIICPQAGTWPFHSRSIVTKHILRVRANYGALCNRLSGDVDEAIAFNK